LHATATYGFQDEYGSIVRARRLVAVTGTLRVIAHVVARAAMPAAAAMQREPVGLIFVAVLAMTLIGLLLRLLPAAGDERRQPIDVAAFVATRLAMLWTIVMLLLLVALIKGGLRLAHRIRMALLHVRLRLWFARAVARLAAAHLCVGAVIVVV